MTPPPIDFPKDEFEGSDNESNHEKATNSKDQKFKTNQPANGRRGARYKSRGFNERGGFQNNRGEYLGNRPIYQEKRRGRGERGRGGGYEGGYERENERPETFIGAYQEKEGYWQTDERKEIYQQPQPFFGGNQPVHGGYREKREVYEQPFGKEYVEAYQRRPQANYGKSNQVGFERGNKVIYVKKNPEENQRINMAGNPGNQGNENDYNDGNNENTIKANKIQCKQQKNESKAEREKIRSEVPSSAKTVAQ